MSSVYRSRTRPYGGSAAKGSKTRETRSYWNAQLFDSSEAVTNSPDFAIGREDCKDRLTISLPFEDHDLTIDKRYCKPNRINGTVKYPDQAPNFGTQYVDTFSNYWSSARFGSAYNTGLPSLPAIDWSGLQTQAISKTNPNTPVVDLPLFLFELKDFPSMLRDLGRVLRKEISPVDVPGGFLAYRFGWAPLISDLVKLLNLADAIDSRLRILKSARAGKKIHGTLQKDLGSTINSSIVDVYTLGNLNIKVRLFSVYHSIAWYTVRLKPTDVPGIDELISRYSAYEGSNLLDGALLGLDYRSMSAATLWNAIPWSWLIDYFSNVGVFLESKRGVIPFTLVDMNIMVKQWIVDTDEVVFNNTRLKYSPHNILIERKNRKAVSVPSAKIVLDVAFTGGQFSIVSALVVARALRGAGFGNVS